MDQQSQETSEVLTFAPRQRIRNESDAIDDVGHTLVAMLKEAATLSQQNVDRAMTMAHKLSVQLRASEDRVQQLESARDRRLTARTNRSAQARAAGAALSSILRPSDKSGRLEQKSVTRSA